MCGVQSFLPSPSTSSLWFIGILPGPTPLGIVFISFDKLIRALVHRYSTRTHSTGDCRPLRRQAPPRSGSSVFYPDPLHWGLSSPPLTTLWFIGILPGPTPLGIVVLSVDRPIPALVHRYTTRTHSAGDYTVSMSRSPLPSNDPNKSSHLPRSE